ncbi:MAG: DUF3293 domain-containing protein [Gemmatimonadetes bacterium]|nr:DUF3293 domain-containing protein [Gemmatimonadota bacterium]
MNESKLRTYASTILEFVGRVQGEVDLRRPMGLRERGLLSQLELDSPFAVLTGYNPHGENEHPRNQERQDGLRDTLAEEAKRFVLVDGCSPDRLHREPSIAACIPEHRAWEIALQFEQDAFFWFDGNSFHLVGAGEPLGRVRLPLRAL